MKKLLLSLLIILPITAVAQKFFVEKADAGADNVLINKLIELNKSVVFRQDSSDFTIRCMFQKKTIGIAKGYVAIINTSSGEIIAKSEEATGRANLGHGYKNPSLQIATRVSEKYLPKMIESLNK